MQQAKVDETVEMGKSDSMEGVSSVFRQFAENTTAHAPPKVSKSQ